MEFDNASFYNKINEIISLIQHDSTDKCVINDISPKIKFNKISIDFSNILTWLGNVNIYYSYDYDIVTELFQGDAIVADQYNNLNNFIEVNKNYINNCSIFLAVDKNYRNFYKKYTKIILHELGHLYTNKNLKEYHLKNKDLINHYSRNVNELIEQIESNDINNFNEDDIWDLFTYIMYYANLSESHAFMENINFEMLRTLSSPANYKLNLQYKHIEKTEYNLFKYSSGILQIYCWLNELLDACKTIDEQIKQQFDIKYNNEIKQIYEKSLSCNKLIKKYQKIIQHILLNSKKLFTKYASLYNLDKEYLMEKYIFAN